jgi:hypothetical protein
MNWGDSWLRGAFVFEGDRLARVLSVHVSHFGPPSWRSEVYVGESFLNFGFKRGMQLTIKLLRRSRVTQTSYWAVSDISLKCRSGNRVRHRFGQSSVCTEIFCA